MTAGASGADGERRRPGEPWPGWEWFCPRTIVPFQDWLLAGEILQLCERIRYPLDALGQDFLAG